MNNQIKISNSLKFILISFMLFFGSITFADTVYKEVTVNSIAQLEEAVAASSTPTRIVLADGTYNSSDISLSGNSAEVHVVAKTKGQAIIQRTINVYGNNITIEGFKFNGGSESSDIGGRVYVYGDDCHITRCNWDDSQARKWLITDYYAYRTEISYNIFQNKNNNTLGSSQRPRETVQLNFHTDDTNGHDHYVHHNHWRDIKKGKFSNAYEALQIYTEEDGEEASVNGANQNTLVEYNLFERCDGEGEIISNKCNASTIRYNTFIDSDGALTLRWGNGSEVYGNTLLGGKAGIVVSGKYHKIHNNYVENMSSEGILLREGAPGMDGYGAPDGVEISSNTLINCGDGALRIGKATTTEYGGEVIKNSTISNNILLRASNIAVQITSPNSDARVIAGISFSQNMYQGTLDSALENGFAKYTTEEIGGPSDTTNTAVMTESTTGPGVENIDYQPAPPAEGAFIIKQGTLL